MSDTPNGSGLTIRPFRPEDFPAIVAAAAQTGWEHLSPAEQTLANREDVTRRAYLQTVQALSMPGICFVAEDRGRLVAYELVVLRPDETSGIMEGLKLDGWVDPAYRGRGLNRYMHQAGEDWCRGQGIQRMVAVVAAHNQASQRATEKAGFETVHVIRAKWLSR